MAQILVRKLEDDVLARLKERAKRNGRSAEAEIRSILAEAVATSPRPPYRSLLELVGAGSSGRSQAQINEDIRALRDEWED